MFIYTYIHVIYTCLHVNVFSGVPGGTLVVSEKAVNAYLREEHDTVSFDK